MQEYENDQLQIQMPSHDSTSTSQVTTRSDHSLDCTHHRTINLCYRSIIMKVNTKRNSKSYRSEVSFDRIAKRAARNNKRESVIKAKYAA